MEIGSSYNPYLFSLNNLSPLQKYGGSVDAAKGGEQRFGILFQQRIAQAAPENPASVQSQPEKSDIPEALSQNSDTTRERDVSQLRPDPRETQYKMREFLSNSALEVSAQLKKMQIDKEVEGYRNTLIADMKDSGQSMEEIEKQVQKFRSNIAKGLSSDIHQSGNGRTAELSLRTYMSISSDTAIK